MLAVFGPLGSVLGAVVAVGAALGTVFVKSTSATKGFKDGVQQLKEETKQAAANLEVFRAGVQSIGEVKVQNKILSIQADILKTEVDIAAAKEKATNIRQRQLRDLNPTLEGLKQELKDNQELLRNYRDITTAKQASLDIGKQMNAVELAHASILGNQLQAVENIQHGYDQYYNSRIAAAIMAARQETKSVQQAHADQLRIMGETTQQAVSNAAKSRQAYAEYYASRIQGEMDAQAVQNEFRGARRGPTFKELYDNDPRVQLSQNLMMLRLKEQKEKEAADAKALAAAKRLSNSLKQEITPEMKKIIDLSNNIGSSFENALMSATRGTLSVRDAFRAMATDIIAELYRVFVVKQITGFVTQTVAGMFGSPLAPSQSLRPRARPMANGGPVSAGSPYMVGERGPELMIPNQSGSIIPNDKLGGGTVVVNQNINVTTGVQQTVRAEILGLMPQIQEASKAAVLDAKRRGGSFAGAF